MPGIDANTKLCIHAGEVDASTTPADSSPDNITLTARGNAQVDTAQQKFGTGSLLFDGTGDAFTAPDSASWDVFGTKTDNYTIDFWVKFNSRPGLHAWLAQGEDATNFWTIRKYADHTVGVYCVDAGATVLQMDSVAGAFPDDSAWHHVCFVKIGDATTPKYAVYLDGTQISYGTSTGVITYAGLLDIGGAYFLDGNYFNGWLDEVRIQKSNYFSAAPVVGLTDTIDVPTEAYSFDLNPSVSDSITITESNAIIRSLATVTNETLSVADVPTVGAPFFLTDIRLNQEVQGVRIFS